MSDPVLAPPGITLRRATVDDAPALLRLFDTATSWLAAQGRSGQWGDGKESSASNPTRVAHFTGYASMPGAWVATTSPPTGDADSVVVGAVTVDPAAPEYVRPADGPEMYVRLLITDRAWKGRGLGNYLVAKAKELTREAGVGVMRVDCYAGADGKLVRWYESAGFEKVETFMAKEGTWPGQVLVMRVDGAKEDGLA